MEQRSEEWFKSRLGKITASNASKVMAKGKSGAESKTRASYMAQLICEILTGERKESFTTEAIQRGIDLEASARNAYSLQFFDRDVSEVGFIECEEYPFIGASPDGLVNDDGLIEIKCPETHTHIDTILSGKPKSDYYWQMQMQMLCTGRKWCDFVSYDDRMPEEMQMFIIRIDRNDDDINRMIDECKLFHGEMMSKIEKLKEIVNEK